MPPRSPTIEALEPRTLLSVAIELDYSFDTHGFFDDPNRRAVVEFAADWVGSLLQDDLLAIIPGGSNSWTATFVHPATGGAAEVDNPTIPEDTVRIYVGGRDLGGSRIGVGGAGGWSATGSPAFFSLIEGRGQPGAIGPESGRTDFALWGGAAAFDIDTAWHTGLSTQGLGSGESDLLSLALHEFAHVLGFTADAPAFANLISGSQFTGPGSIAEFTAPEFAFSGDTTGMARWRRPETLSLLSSTATSVPFQAVTTTVTRSGVYDILSDQTSVGAMWDGFLLVYRDSFDPAAPLDNLIALNDDYTGALLPGTGPGYSGVDDLFLAASRSYIIVTTGATNADDGAYHLQILRQPQDLLLAGDESHWRDGTFSRGQEAGMDPTIARGTRKLLTPLDLAALADIGWEVAGPLWPGVGAAVTLDLATGASDAEGAASAETPGRHRFMPAQAGFLEVVAEASAPVTLRLWDSAGRLVAESELAGTGASVIAYAAAEVYTLEIVAASSATYQLRFATTPAGHRLYFPEGFATARTTEVVWLTNPGPEPVSFTLTMRYEDPLRPRAHNILASGEILAPGARAPLDISRGGAFATDALSGEMILIDTPYALVLEATGHLAAAVERSDVFGGQQISTAEDFIAAVDRTWTFARAQKEPGAVHDFLVFYNPHDHEARIAITFFTGAGQVQMEQVLGPQRRGGLNLNRESLPPAGISGVVITSAPLLSAHEGTHDGVVAALSHFDAAGSEGWLVTGHAGPLPPAGFLGAGTHGAAEILVFNPGLDAAALQLEDGTGVVATIDIAPFATLAQPAPTAPGLRYRFTSGAGAVQLVERSPGEAASAGPQTALSRNHFFGVADLARSGPPGSVGEGAVVVFNPGPAPTEVRFRFLLREGGEATATLNVGAGSFATLLLRDIPALLATRDAFSVILRSNAPVAAAMSLFDSVAIIGWGSAGAPAGVLDPIG